MLIRRDSMHGLRMMKGHIRAQEDLQQKCIFAAEDIAKQLTQEVSKVIDGTFGKIEEGFHKALSFSEDKSAKRTRLCVELGQLADEFDVLRGELLHFSEEDKKYV